MEYLFVVLEEEWKIFEDGLLKFEMVGEIFVVFYYDKFVNFDLIFNFKVSINY